MAEEDSQLGDGGMVVSLVGGEGSSSADHTDCRFPRPDEEEEGKKE